MKNNLILLSLSLFLSAAAYAAETSTPERKGHVTRAHGFCGVRFADDGGDGVTKKPSMPTCEVIIPGDGPITLPTGEAVQRVYIVRLNSMYTSGRRHADSTTLEAEKKLGTIAHKVGHLIAQVLPERLCSQIVADLVIDDAVRCCDSPLVRVRAIVNGIEYVFYVSIHRGRMCDAAKLKKHFGHDEVSTCEGWNDFPKRIAWRLKHPEISTDK